MVDDMEEARKRTFCPIELRNPIIKLEESHLCAHPLYQAAQLQHQRAYGNGLLSKYMSSVTSTSYLKHGLTCGRTENWARSCNPCIPALKTIIILESQ
jgi:hypothetical protein